MNDVDTRVVTHTHTQDKYRNPPAHEAAIAKLKRGKSCGPDGIFPEHILFGCSAYKLWLVKIFNGIIDLFQSTRGREGTHYWQRTTEEFLSLWLLGNCSNASYFKD